MRRVRELIPGARVVGAYGPAGTGTALHVPDASTRVLPAGPARAYVLDSALRPVPAGVTGELYIGGAVARGWPGRPGDTALRFLPDPFGPAGARMYRTGTSPERCDDGALEYAGHGGPWARVGGQRVPVTGAPRRRWPRIPRSPMPWRWSARTPVRTARTGSSAMSRRCATAGWTSRCGSSSPGRLQDSAVGGGRGPGRAADAGGFGRRPRCPAGHAAPPRRSGGAGGRGRQGALRADRGRPGGGTGGRRADDFFTLGCNSLKATRIIGRMRPAPSASRSPSGSSSSTRTSRTSPATCGPPPPRAARAWAAPCGGWRSGTARAPHRRPGRSARTRRNR
ncbi:hypothetical protein STENM327S_05634 [Streptomyces tendae]